MQTGRRPSTNCVPDEDSTTAAAACGARGTGSRAEPPSNPPDSPSRCGPQARRRPHRRRPRAGDLTGSRTRRCRRLRLPLPRPLRRRTPRPGAEFSPPRIPPSSQAPHRRPGRLDRLRLTVAAHRSRCRSSIRSCVGSAPMKTTPAKLWPSSRTARSVVRRPHRRGARACTTCARTPPICQFRRCAAQAASGPQGDSNVYLARPRTGFELTVEHRAALAPPPNTRDKVGADTPVD